MAKSKEKIKPVLELLKEYEKKKAKVEEKYKKDCQELENQLTLIKQIKLEEDKEIKSKMTKLSNNKTIKS